MNTNEFDPVTHEENQNREVRAAVDVMFEALAHIQASLETTSKEKRLESYRKFKGALYDRFEYLIDERTADAQKRKDAVSRANEETVSEDKETLQKLWPDLPNFR